MEKIKPLLKPAALALGAMLFLSLSVALGLEIHHHGCHHHAQAK